MVRWRKEACGAWCLSKAFSIIMEQNVSIIFSIDSQGSSLSNQTKKKDGHPDHALINVSNKQFRLSKYKVNSFAIKSTWERMVAP